MIGEIKRGWTTKFPEDLAWDIFTLDCMLASTLAMLMAALASSSDKVSQQIADSERWVWISAATMAIVALVCLLRIYWSDQSNAR